MSTAPAIELKRISKAFGPVQANKNIDIKVMPGTIHGIIGENGAGKSTLMSILYGFYQADSGPIKSLLQLKMKSKMKAKDQKKLFNKKKKKHKNQKKNHMFRN